MVDGWAHHRTTRTGPGCARAMKTAVRGSWPPSPAAEKRLGSSSSGPSALGPRGQVRNQGCGLSINLGPQNLAAATRDSKSWRQSEPVSSHAIANTQPIRRRPSLAQVARQLRFCMQALPWSDLQRRAPWPEVRSQGQQVVTLGDRHENRRRSAYRHRHRCEFWTRQRSV